MSKRLLPKQWSTPAGAHNLRPRQPLCSATAPYGDCHSGVSPSLPGTSLSQTYLVSPDSGFCSPDSQTWSSFSAPNSPAGSAATPSISSTPKVSAQTRSLPRLLSKNFSAASPQATTPESEHVVSPLVTQTEQGQLLFSPEYITELNQNIIISQSFQQILDECSGSQRPKFSYMDLIKMAIMSSEEEEMTLQEIINWIETYFPYFKNIAKDTWKNSVRHNLSLHRDFVKMERKRRGAKWKIADHAKNHHIKIPKLPVVKPKRDTSPMFTKSNCKKGLQPILPKAPFTLVPISQFTHSGPQSPGPTHQLIIPVQSRLPAPLPTSPAVAQEPTEQQKSRMTLRATNQRQPSHHQPRIIQEKGRKVQKSGSPPKASIPGVKQGGGDNSSKSASGPKGPLKPLNVQILNGNSGKEKKIVFHLKNKSPPTKHNNQSDLLHVNAANQIFSSFKPQPSATVTSSADGQNLRNDVAGENILTFSPSFFYGKTEGVSSTRRKVCCCPERCCSCKTDHEPTTKRSRPALKSIENVCSDQSSTSSSHFPAANLRSSKRSPTSGSQPTSKMMSDLSSTHIEQCSSPQQEAAPRRLRSRRKQNLSSFIPEISPPKIIHPNPGDRQSSQVSSPEIVLSCNLSQGQALFDQLGNSPTNCEVTPPAGGHYFTSTPNSSPQDKMISGGISLTPDKLISDEINLTPDKLKQGAVNLMSVSPYSARATMTRGKAMPSSGLSPRLNSSLPDPISLDLTLLDNIEPYLDYDFNDSFKLPGL